MSLNYVHEAADVSDLYLYPMLNNPEKGFGLGWVPKDPCPPH